MDNSDNVLFTEILEYLEWSRIMLNLDGDSAGDILLETIEKVRARLG